MADRGEVKIREGNLGDLIKVYRAAYKDVVTTITDATTAGKIRKAQTLAEIKRTLQALGDDVDAWVKREIPQYYLDGANVALTDLNRLGVDVTKPKSFAIINREAITALTDEVSLAFAEGITGIYRNAARVISDAQKQQLNLILAQGKLTGESLKTVAAAVQETLKTQGLSALIDRGGRSWDFEVYANMLVRTKAVEARNLGLQNRMVSAGYDLVQVSNHGSTHPACRFWEGKILSSTGRTKGYPTVDQAKRAGLFHPNCQHAINVINLDLAQKTQAYDNPWLRQNAEPPKAPSRLAQTFGITGNKLTLNQSGKNVTIKLTEGEGQFMRTKGISVYAGPNQYTRGSTRGAYVPALDTLFIKDINDKNFRKTFFHELGHSIDYRTLPGTKRLIDDSTIDIAMSKDRLGVVTRRLELDGISPERAAAYAQNKPFEGRKPSTSFIRYTRSRSEVFADGYGQYRTDPAAFKKVAPNLYTVYEGLFK